MGLITNPLFFSPVTFYFLALCNSPILRGKHTLQKFLHISWLNCSTRQQLRRLGRSFPEYLCWKQRRHDFTLRVLKYIYLLLLVLAPNRRRSLFCQRTMSTVGEHCSIDNFLIKSDLMNIFVVGDKRDLCYYKRYPRI